VTAILTNPQRTNDVEAEYIELAQKLEVVQQISMDKANVPSERMSRWLQEITAYVIPYASSVSN
jgi:hypothetical protein